MTSARAPAIRSARVRDLAVGLDDALSVLRQLLARRPELRANLAAILTEGAATIDRDEVAADLADALQSIPIEDVWAQSGRAPYGYVDPREKAAELLLAAAEGEIARMERLLEQGEPAAATAVLLGIVLAADAVGSSRTNPVLLEVGDGLESIPFVAAERWTRAAPAFACGSAGCRAGLGRLSLLLPREPAEPPWRRTPPRARWQPRCSARTWTR